MLEKVKRYRVSEKMNSKEGYAIMALLKICARKKDLYRGSELHAHILKKGLLDKSPYLASPLINMYVKCGMFEKAQEVLEGLHVGDLVSWNVLISAYVSKRQIHEAFKCFERMQNDGFSPDAITFTCILKLCGSIKNIDKGREIHERVVRSGLLAKDIVLGTALVDMYAKNGMLEKAQEVLDQLSVKDTIAWNALIGGYAQQGRGHEALNCFDRMQSEGLSPNVVTFICILKACGSTESLDRGKKIHDEIVHRKLLEKGNVLGNALVDMYAKCGMLTKARHVLEELPSRDVISWNALIAGFSHYSQGHEALKCFESMQNEGLSPNEITFTCVLKACGSTGSIEKGKQIHEEIANRGLLWKDIVLGSALVDMYVKCGDLGKAQRVLEELPVRNVVSWSTLIAGYAQHRQGRRALDSFARMQSEGFTPNIVTFICVLNACGSTRDIEKGKQIHEEVASRGLLAEDVVLGNALVDMYAKCDLLAKAHQVLIELPVRSVASWNTLIAGYIEKQQFHQSVDCYGCMQADGVFPDVVTFISILKACGNIGAVDKGEQVHEEIVNQRLIENDIILGNALVDMYAKCGLLVKAEDVLEELPIRNVVSWNALISGYAEQGQCHEALNCLERMCNEGVSPDEVTFLCILSACSHLKLLEETQTLLLNMKGIYGVTPNIEHYTCMVVGFGCAGHFGEAISVIQAMPSFDCVIFLALLSACQKRGNVKLGKLAFDQILQLDISCTSAYILMANIFSVAGMQADSEKIELMRQQYATSRKQGDSSWMLVEKFIDFSSTIRK